MVDNEELLVTIGTEYVGRSYKRRDVKKKPGGEKVAELTAVLCAAATVYKANIHQVLQLTWNRGGAKDARHVAIYVAFVHLRISPEDICAYFHFKTESPVRDAHWNISRRLCKEEDLRDEVDGVLELCALGRKADAPEEEAE